MNDLTFALACGKKETIVKISVLHVLLHNYWTNPLCNSEEK